MSFRLLKNLLKNPEVRLWRRAQFCLGQSDFIFAEGARDVCEGDHSLNVMNQWGALTMKIRCRRFGESRPSLRDRTGQPPDCAGPMSAIDRKSTRLNSSH